MCPMANTFISDAWLPTSVIYGKCYIWFIIMKSYGHMPFLQKKKKALHADLPQAIRGKHTASNHGNHVEMQISMMCCTVCNVCKPISFRLFDIDRYIDQGGFHFLAVLIEFGFAFLFSNSITKKTWVFSVEHKWDILKNSLIDLSMQRVTVVFLILFCILLFFQLTF